MPKARVKKTGKTKELAGMLLKAFHQIDKDGDNQLTLPEFRDFLTASDIDPSFAELAFVIFDADKSGYLDFEEFVSFVVYQSLAEEHPRQYFAKAFVAFDADNSGTLDASELEAYFKLTGVENPAELAGAIISAAGGKPLTFDQLADLLELAP
jgi:Ca2+-binding EF-hand superfamily protein